jgi:hypothetical protein
MIPTDAELFMQATADATPEGKTEVPMFPKTEANL